MISVVVYMNKEQHSECVNILDSETLFNKSGNIWLETLYINIKKINDINDTFI